ncbi:type IV pilus modification PilV family protein [Noviherbaspirillum sp.]|uniref:type IV pilus modification PilV family protein n=1 Tax=Noviherbaspirillum sp. TaxID=1926288 RepID=UPI002FDF99FE
MNITTKNQRGIVIIENLIALLIFSLGILGLVGMMAVSTKDSATAKYRSEASLFAGQIIGQMWAADKNNAILKANFESPSGVAYAPWQASVVNSLPGAAANPPEIVIDANNVVRVTVSWQGPGEHSPHNFVAVARVIATNHN